MRGWFVIRERLVLPRDWLDFRATREIFSGLTREVLSGQHFYVVILVIPLIIYIVVAKIIFKTVPTKKIAPLILTTF
jgi:hypothetical protein